MKQIEASAKSFYNYANRAQCEILADLFYDNVESVFKNHHRDYALQFFTHLSPTFLRRSVDLVKLKAIYERAKETTNTTFIVAVFNEIELFE